MGCSRVGLALSIMVLHFLTDWLKSYMQLKTGVFTETDKGVVPGKNNRKDLWIFLADQTAHLAVLVGNQNTC